MITVKQFLLKKFPTKDYIDCPVPEHYWEVMQEYAESYHAQFAQPAQGNVLDLLIQEIRENIHGYAVCLKESDLTEKEKAHYAGGLIAAKDILRKACELKQSATTPQPAQEGYSEANLRDRVISGLERELKRQKDSGKEFISDEQVDTLIDDIIKNELNNKSCLQNIWSDTDMIDFHNFVFRHDNKFLKMGDYLNQFKQVSSLPAPSAQPEYTKQDLIDLVDQIKYYTRESHSIIGFDDRDAIELVDLFLSTRIPAPSAHLEMSILTDGYKMVSVNGVDYLITGDDFHNKNLKDGGTAYHWKTKEIGTVHNKVEETGSWEFKTTPYITTMRDSYKLCKVLWSSNNSEASAQVSEAVEFAEWVSKKYTYVENDKWDGDNDETISTTELYNIFLNRGELH